MAPLTGSNGGLIVSFGKMLIDFVPTVSGVSLADAPGFLNAPGGAPSNVAIAVARLGGKAAFVSKLSDDEFGHMLAGILRDNGVAYGGVLFHQGVRTALAFITLRADGESKFMFYRNPSTDMFLTPTELNLPLIKSAKIFHYRLISQITEPCRSEHMEAMKAARESGALLLYDPNLRPPLWPSSEVAKDQIMSIWKEADIINVSGVELEFLTSSSSVEDDIVLVGPYGPPKKKKRILKLYLVTLAEKGCKYYTKNFHGSVEGLKVKAVDSTGAGDAFVGALLCKIVDDQSIIQDEGKLRAALKFANACGAITTTMKGVIPALPNETQALTLLKGA